MINLKRKVAVVGYAETLIGKYPDKTPKDWALEAAKKAIENAGISKEEIDGVITTSSFSHPQYTIESSMGVISQELKIYPKFHTHVFLGGSTSCIALKMVAGMICTGQLNYALIITADSWGSAPFELWIEAMITPNHSEWEVPYGFYMNGAVALMTQRYMYETGTSPEQLASVCVSNRKWAMLKPNAMFRNPLSVEDVLKSKMVCDPLHSLECNRLADGGAALLVTSAERAKELTDTPVYLLGTGGKFVSSHKCESYDVTTFGLKEAGQQAYEMAGIGPKDIDIAEIYDAYPIISLISLEDLGFCPRGEAGKFVKEGHTWPGGKLPMTTNGGMLSQGHIGAGGGMLLEVEAVQQLMGKAERERQVKNAEIAIVTGTSGIFDDGQVVIMGR